MKSGKFIILCLVTVSSVLNISNAAQVVITENIIAKDVEPIGANLTTIAGGTNFAINNHVWNSGFEPIAWRKMVRIDRAGNNWFEWDSHGGPGYWNLAWTGLGNGAEVRFYRIVDKNGQPLSYQNGSDMNETSGADHVILLGKATVPMPNNNLPNGGYISNDDRDGNTENDMQRIYIDTENIKLRFGDYAYMTKKAMNIGPETSPPDLRKHYRGNKPFFNAGDAEWEGELVKHPLPLPDSFTDGGESCLHAVFPKAGEIVLQQYVYHNLDDGEGQWYSQLTPGAKYRVSVWLRQKNLGDNGRVKFVFNNASAGYHEKSQPGYWNVTDKWQKFTYDFTAPGYPTDASYHISHGLEFTGPGEVWIDNFLLYRYDKKHDFSPFTPHQISFDGMMNSIPSTGKKPAIRFYGPIYHHAFIDSMFTDYSNSGWDVAWNMGYQDSASMTIAQCMKWAYSTGNTPENRAVPYLTCIDEYTEDEWKALAEYLGVPYDPSIDNPKSKPYAYMRYIYRNKNGVPWTEEFREILVEYGNETWHNGAGGYGWDGWGPPGYVHHGGQEYGLFAKYMFNDNVMKMPEWQKYNLGNKIKFVLGGNYEANPQSETSYGEEAIRQKPAASYIGHANYVGPKWETSDASPKDFTPAGLQETLISRLTSIGNVIADAAKTRDLFAQQNINYEVIAYEGGPSGYWQNKDNPIIDEYYGKSEAMGLAALDAWLYSSSVGFKHQCYLGFSSGKWWSSHTLPEAGGFRPHCGWLTLQMRNKYVVGDNMVQVKVSNEPKINRKGESIPALAVYSFKNDNTYSIFLLNRHISEYIPVTIKLPTKANKITLHKLAAPDGKIVKPADNNIEKQNVAIKTLKLTADGKQNLTIDSTLGATYKGLEPGAVYLYIIN